MSKEQSDCRWIDKNEWCCLYLFRANKSICSRGWVNMMKQEWIVQSINLQPTISLCDQQRTFYQVSIFQSPSSKRSKWDMASFFKCLLTALVWKAWSIQTVCRIGSQREYMRLTPLFLWFGHKMNWRMDQITVHFKYIFLKGCLGYTPPAL